jgi:hypothetical protein
VKQKRERREKIVWLRKVKLRLRIVWLFPRAWQRHLSLLFRRVGWVRWVGWLEELELKQALALA